MAKCEVCKKKTHAGRSISHSAIKTNRVFKPNIQVAWAIVDGRKMKLHLCTKCLKKLRAGQKEEKAKVTSVEVSTPKTA